VRSIDSNQIPVDLTS